MNTPSKPVARPIPDGVRLLVRWRSDYLVTALLDCLLHERKFDLARDIFALAAEHFELTPEQRADAAARLDAARAAARAREN